MRCANIVNPDKCFLMSSNLIENLKSTIIAQRSLLVTQRHSRTTKQTFSLLRRNRKAKIIYFLRGPFQVRKISSKRPKSR